jgi:hypothetical protein
VSDRRALGAGSLNARAAYRVEADIESVPSRAYQTAKTAASSTENTVVLIHSGTPIWSVRMSV